MNLSLTPAEHTLVDSARDFAHAAVRPHAAGWEQARTVPVETFRAAAQAGLAGLLVPPAWGGQGVSMTAFAAVMEALAAECLPFTFMVVVHNNLAGNIARNGTDTQRERYLPAMLAGAQVGAFCLTEPGAGSDAAAITTRAREVPQGWALDGEKAWVTNGAVADLFSIYAQTDPAQGWRGIACLLAEAETPGLEREAPYALMGGHAMGTAGLALRNCVVPAENLLLPAGRAFKAAMEGIDIARATVAAMCCGMLQRGLEVAVAYARERRVFGQRVAALQGVRWQLADVATHLEAARLLTYQATGAIDAGADATLAAAHAKKFATRAALDGLGACMQAMGAVGYRAEYPLGRHLASAKMAQFLDGTTEIQNVVISRGLFGRLEAEGHR